MCSCKCVSALFHTLISVTGLTFHYNTPDSINLPSFPRYPVGSFLLQDTEHHKLSLQPTPSETGKLFGSPMRAVSYKAALWSVLREVTEPRGLCSAAETITVLIEGWHFWHPWKDTPPYIIWCMLGLWKKPSETCISKQLFIQMLFKKPYVCYMLVCKPFNYD